MRGFSRTAAGVCLALVAPVILGASSIDLTTIEFPERQTVEFDLLPQSGAPDAKINGKVTFREGLAQIDVNYASMKPAILYGGDVTAYVVWAIARDGSAENLGELVAATPKGNRSFSSAKKRFALIVTAEPYYLVSRPSGLVSFINGLPKKKKVTSEGFTFAGLIEAPDHAMESIRDISWESKEPLALLQARKAYELAGRYGAPDYTKQIYAEAKEALDHATEFQTKGNNNKKLLEYAGQSVELSNSETASSTCCRYANTRSMLGRVSRPRSGRGCMRPTVS